MPRWLILIGALCIVTLCWSIRVLLRSVSLPSNADNALVVVNTTANRQCGAGVAHIDALCAKKPYCSNRPHCSDNNVWRNQGNLQLGDLVNASLDHPFVFWHLPKSGGSSLRFLMKQSVFKNVTTIIPCENLHCKITAADLTQRQWLNRTSCAVAFLMHFEPRKLAAALFDINSGKYGPTECKRNWPTIESKLDRQYLQHTLMNHVNCLTIVREPVERLWSHHYFFGQEDGDLKEYLMQRGAAKLVEKTGGNYQSTLLSLDINDAALSNCKVVTYDHYDDALSWLRETFPTFQANSGIRKASSSKKYGNVDTLSMKERATLADALRQDGALYARVRDSCSRGRLTPEQQCRSVCWNSFGCWWLPQG
jgi:hypothetical protein